MSRIVICYIPGLHQGYFNLFSHYPGELRIMGLGVIQEVPRLDRDIRALDPREVVKMIEAVGAMSPVSVINTPQDLVDVRSDTEFVLPDEDISHAFAEHYLVGHTVIFVPIFLRWDRQISTTEFEVPLGRTVSTEELARTLIGQATQAAPRSPDWWRQVGAVIARNGEPLLVGYNRPLVAPDQTLGVFGDPRSNFDYGEYIELAKSMHAEAHLVAMAAKQGLNLDGTELYVSTFPCPVCAKLVAEAGISRVYYAKGYSMLDAEDILAAYGIELVLVQMETPSATVG